MDEPWVGRLTAHLNLNYFVLKDQVVMTPASGAPAGIADRGPTLGCANDAEQRRTGTRSRPLPATAGEGDYL
jgi:hypothetical protein